MAIFSACIRLIRRRSNAVSAIEPLILDFVAWVAARPRPYGEVMEAWRTSCPRLTVWEDALDAGLVARVDGDGREQAVRVTAQGLDFLHAHGRSTSAQS
jgi:hypothetical protein